MKIRKAICLLLSTLLVVGTLTTGAAALDAVSKTVYQGIDVSEFQGEIDFSEVRESGIEVVYIRAGEGYDYTDPYFEENTAGAKAAGLKYGFYLYVTAGDAAEARQQAQFFAKLIEGTGYECRPAMDLEDFSGFTDQQINTIGMAFLEELQAQTGVLPLIYTDSSAANEIWDSTFGAYPLWAADYDVEEPGITSGIWSGWSGYQYSDVGSVSGIADNVDMDLFTDGVFLSSQEKDTNKEQTPDKDPSSQSQQNATSYTVTAGNTLWQIAQNYHTTIAALVEANHIQNPNLIYVGQILKIPGSSGETADQPASQPTEKRETQYTVVAGDTLWQIAINYHTTIAAIVQANGIANPNLIYAGQVLWIPSQTETKTESTYTVVAGNTLWQIAMNYQTTVAAIAAANDIQNPNLIYAGQVLQIPAG